MIKRVFISQPMKGLSDEQIKIERNNTFRYAESQFPDDNLSLIESYQEDYPGDNVKTIPIAYLAKSIACLAKADIVVLASGWYKARGCQIEARIAKEYGIEHILDMDLSIADYKMDFSRALELIKQGKLMCRKGWNGKNMCVAYQKGYIDGIPCNKQTAETWSIEEGSLFKCKPYLQIKNVDGTFSMWVPSIGDVLADDWMLYNA